MKNKKRILFAASESVPFIKTGGLADVVGALPKYFDKNEYDVRVIIPKYACISEEYKRSMEYIGSLTMSLGWRNQYVGIFKTEYKGITVYFIDNEFYFQGERPYGEIYTDIEKFAFFSKAVLTILPVIGFKPSVIHCNDWQTALIPVYLRESFGDDPFYGDIRTLLSVHNLKFQGIWGLNNIKDATGLPDSCFTDEKMEFYGAANLLKGGLVYADKISTVSKTYAYEIQTEFYGEYLDGLLRGRRDDLVGIINGLDYSVYDPVNDPCIEAPIRKESFASDKKKNKSALQNMCGLKADPDVMLIGIVSRLTDQKGLDLVDCVMNEIASDPVQLVVLGTGDAKYEEMFRYFAERYPDKISTNILYNEELSHRIYAGCDAFLMPSLFEPCGLSQLMAMRYGTLPIVRETGGLKDTVDPYNEYENTGTGFSFANYNAHEMLDMIRYSEDIFYNKRSDWDQIAVRAMEKDFSWTHAAKEYDKLYKAVLE